MTPDAFVDGLLGQFKAQSQEEAQESSLFADYLGAIEEDGFAPPVLKRAYKAILRNHMTPWLPKVAEVLRYCRDARDAEAFDRIRSGGKEEARSESAGVERGPGGSISTTVAFTRKIHRACGKTENAEKFRFVWVLVKENYAHLPLTKLEARLIAAARFLSQGCTPAAAVQKAFDEDAGEGARKVGGDPWTAERVEEADRLIQSDVGVRAAQEGWIIALHDWCRENRELPGVDRAAKIRAAALQRAEQRAEWARTAEGTPRSLSATAVERARQAKDGRLAKVALGAVR
jgi:hypothetical protein